MDMTRAMAVMSTTSAVGSHTSGCILSRSTTADTMLSCAARNSSE